MLSKNFRLILLAACQSASMLLAQNLYGNLDGESLRFVTPRTPRAEDTIVFRYPAEEGTGAVALDISTDLPASSERIPMEISDGVWRATWTLRDTAARLLLFAFHVDDWMDDNDGMYYELPVYGDRGIPLRGAFEAAARSLSGLDDRRPEDLEAALERIEQEIRWHPVNYGARLFRITLLLKSDRLDAGTRFRIVEETEELKKSHGTDPDFLRYAIQAYRQIGEESRAGSYEEALIRVAPRDDQAVLIRMGRILETEDAAVRADRLATLLNENPGSRHAESILSQMATAYIALEDSGKMISVGDRLFETAETPQGASALAGLAGWMAEKRYDTRRAAAYAGRAVRLIDEMDDALRPPEIPAAEWERNKRAVRAGYLDIQGWSRILSGEAEQGVEILHRAAEHLFQPNVFYHLAEGYYRMGRLPDAMIQYARAAAFGGGIGKLAYETLSAIWKSSGREAEALKAFLAREERWVSENHRSRVIAGQMTRPAPDFELESIDGGYVRLSEQRGGVVLLCFWATWSRSSIRALGEIQSLADRYGTDILFLTVAMDPDAESVARFLDRTDMILPVLLNDEVEETFSLGGVPVILLIDPDGVIRFEHKGHRPDLAQSLAVQLDVLLNRP